MQKKKSKKKVVVPKFKECDIVELVNSSFHSNLDGVEKGDWLMISSIKDYGGIEFVWEDRFHCKEIKLSFVYEPEDLKLVKRLIP